MLITPTFRHPTLHLRAPFAFTRSITIKPRRCLFPQLRPTLFLTLRRRARPIEHYISKPLELTPVAKVFELITARIHSRMILALFADVVKYVSGVVTSLSRMLPGDGGTLMTCFKRFACAACLALCALLVPQSSFADYIGLVSSPSFTGAVYRITDTGTVVPTNYAGTIPQTIKDQTETYFAALTLTPNLQKVYSFTNTLGFANYVLAWDTATNAFRLSDTFSPGGVGDNYVNNAGAPIILGNEVFVTSFIGMNFSGNRQVKRYDLTTHALLQTIDPLTPQSLNDIALNASGSLLYVAGTSGIYLYDRISGVYQSTVKSLLLPGVTGNIAVGPDNRLYVRSFATGDVLRYSLSGSFEDTFLSHNDYPNLGTIQFGVDGNLHAFQTAGGGNLIRKFNPSTGALLSSTPAGFMANGRITYLPVPEPACISLFAIFAAAIASRGRSCPR
jgi:hypothetical protein